MPKMLMDGAVEYEDGTPATEAQVTLILYNQHRGIKFGHHTKKDVFIILICKFQMGKDVVSFLSWAAEPEMEERKLVSSCNLPAELSSVLIAKYNFLRLVAFFIS